MNRISRSCIALIVAGTFCWFFPLFHVVPLSIRDQQRQQAAFDAAVFTRTFWKNQLVPALSDAVDIQAVVSAIRRDPTHVAKEFGRTVGLSSKYYLFLQGEGTIVAVDNTGVSVALYHHEGSPEVVLATGLLFGNTVRDATGLLQADKFANSQHFNEVSLVLNQMVETEVVPLLKSRAEVGRRVTFVGCAEVNANSSLLPLKIIPVSVDVASTEPAG